MSANNFVIQNVEDMQEFKDSQWYKCVNYLYLDLKNSYSFGDTALIDTALILEQEITTLAELVATSTSLNSIGFDNFKSTADGLTKLFDAINSNSNINSLIFYEKSDHNYDSDDEEINIENTIWNQSPIIFAKISANRNLSELTLHDTQGYLTNDIVKLFLALKENNSLLQKLDLSFNVTNDNLEALLQFLESDHKLTSLNIKNTMDLFAIRPDLCDRYWLIVNQKNLIYSMDIYNPTAQKISHLSLNNIISFTIDAKDDEGAAEMLNIIIEKMKLREGLLTEVTINFSGGNDLACQLIALDKIISLTIKLDAQNTNIESFYKILPPLENLETLIIVYHRHYNLNYQINYLFSNDILAYIKYNSSITSTNINVESGDELETIIMRNKHNKKVNSLTLIDILKQTKK